MPYVSVAPEVELIRELWGCLNPLGFEAGVYTVFRGYLDESEYWMKRINLLRSREEN